MKINKIAKSILGSFIIILFIASCGSGLKCENCKKVMQPGDTAYTTSAHTSTAGELKELGYHDKLCSSRCLGEFAEKYPSIRNKW